MMYCDSFGACLNVVVAPYLCLSVQYPVPVRRRQRGWWPCGVSVDVGNRSRGGRSCVGTGMSGGRGVTDFPPQICHCRRKVILGKSLSVRTVLVPITSARSTPVLRTTHLQAFSANGGSENLWE